MLMMMQLPAADLKVKSAIWFGFAFLIDHNHNDSKIVFQNFVVRQSSQPRTMALTMVLLPEHGVSSQHYLIVHNNNNKMQIENSDIEFDNILSLVYHYFNVGLVRYFC